MKDALRIRNENFVAAIYFVTAGAVRMEYCYCNLLYSRILPYSRMAASHSSKNSISIMLTAFDRNEMWTRTDQSLNSHHYVFAAVLLFHTHYYTIQIYPPTKIGVIEYFNFFIVNIFGNIHNLWMWGFAWNETDKAENGCGREWSGWVIAENDGGWLCKSKYMYIHNFHLYNLIILWKRNKNSIFYHHHKYSLVIQRKRQRSYWINWKLCEGNFINCCENNYHFLKIPIELKMKILWWC